MKHNKFTKATSIVMSAVVSAMAMGCGVHAEGNKDESTTSERSVVTKVTDFFKNITKEQWIAMGVGASAATALTLIAGHCMAPNELKDVAKNVVTIEKGEGKQKSTVKLLVLKLKGYKFSKDKTADAILVLNTDEKFVFATDAAKTEDKANANAKKEKAPTFAFNTVVELDTDKDKDLTAWIKWVKAQKGLNVKGKFAPAKLIVDKMFTERFVENGKINEDFARARIAFIETLAKSSKKEDKKEEKKEAENKDANGGAGAETKKEQKLKLVATGKAVNEIASGTAKDTEVDVTFGDEENAVATKAKLAVTTTEKINKGSEVQVVLEVAASACTKQKDGKYSVTLKENGTEVKLENLEVCKA